MKKIKILLSVFTALSTISLSACESNTYYTVTFNSKGGTEIESQTVKKNSYAVRPIDPEKNGYTFGDWTSHGVSFDFENTKITDNIVLKATWEVVQYSITYNYSQDGNTNTNPTSYTIEDEVTLYAPSYSVEHSYFAFYQDQNGFQYNGKINKGSTGDLVLTDIWELNMHNVAGGEDQYQGVGDYRYGDEVTIKVIKETPKGYDRGNTLIHSKKDYTIIGCFSEIEFTFTMPDFDVYLTTNYGLIIAWVEYDLDGGTNNSNNPTSVTILESNYTLYAPTKDGYTFVNWTLNGEVITELNVENYIDLNNSKSPRTITAHWQAAE